MARDFILEDDLNTFDGYLRLQGIEPSIAEPKVLATYRQFFDEAMAIRAATPKFGAMKFRPAAGEYRYAVALREGTDLWLTTWVRRSPKGDVYVLIPVTNQAGILTRAIIVTGPSTRKSFDRKMLASQKRQRLEPAFRGCEHLGMHAGHGPKTVGAICEPAMFTRVMECAPGVLGPRDGFVAVDLVEPGCEPLDLYNQVAQTEVFRDTVPWIVVRIGKLAPLFAASTPTVS
jgi:hypothetical protein